MEFATTIELVEALQTRRVSAIELLDRSIARIEAHDDAINAVVVRDFERARAAAGAADAALARGERRPLLGVPMTVKEAIHVAGLPTTWGIPGTQTIEVRESAVAVQRLERAGAVIIGKTNVATQLGDWQTFNPVYGTTNNPWNTARTPGGSSGGGAAALAAGFVSLELGSDLNGSLRIPAHCCGVFAHKPTFGLVPTRGFAPPGVPVLSVNKDVDFGVLGPMARSAADLALALDVIAGPDDAEAIAYTLSLPPPRHTTLRDFRVLVADEHPLVALSSDVRAVLQNAAADLERAGCRVARGSDRLPDLEATARAFVHLLMAFFGADMPDADYEGIKAAAAHLPSSDPAAAELRGLVSSHREWIGMDRLRLGSGASMARVVPRLGRGVVPGAADAGVRSRPQRHQPTHDRSRRRLRTVQVATALDERCFVRGLAGHRDACGSRQNGTADRCTGDRAVSRGPHDHRLRAIVRARVRRLRCAARIRHLMEMRYACSAFSAEPEPDVANAAPAAGRCLSCRKRVSARRRSVQGVSQRCRLHC